MQKDPPVKSNKGGAENYFRVGSGTPISNSTAKKSCFKTTVSVGSA